MAQIEHPAARLAAAHPESVLPCPLCAATVKDPADFVSLQYALFALGKLELRAS